MATHYANGKTTTSGLVFMYDTVDKENCYKGEPTTNLVPNADIMSSWTTYYRTLALSTFTTEFGTTGYRFVNQPSWNGIYRSFNLVNTGLYTFSAWFRYNGGSVDNNGATVYISNYGGGDTAAGLDKSKIGVWQRVTFTVNVTSPSNVLFLLISYGGVDSGTPVPDFSSWEVTMPQIELNSHATPFVNGTRSSTQGLLDLTNRNTINLSNVSFDANAQITFDGTNDYVDCGNLSISAGKITVNAWVKLDAFTSPASHIVDSALNGWHLSVLSNGIPYFWNGITYHTTGTPLILNTWYMLTGVQSTTLDIYVNGVLANSIASDVNVTSNNVWIGAWQSGTRPFNGKILNTQIYNRALNASEILQNYNATKSRFNLA
jgi:hypothetical protein